jgi:transketolase
MTNRALAAAALLAERAIECEVMHVHTIKPLDEHLIVERARRTSLVVTMEEHTMIGGLGSAVTDALVNALGGRVPPIRRFGISDAWVHNYGSQDDLLKMFGLQPPDMAAAIEKSLSERTTFKAGRRFQVL